MVGRRLEKLVLESYYYRASAFRVLWIGGIKRVIKQEPDAKELDFLKELEKHVNKWVAITGYGSDDESIVAAGDSIIEARQKAESQGFKDMTFFKVPPSDKLFVPLAPM